MVGLSYVGYSSVIISSSIKEIFKDCEDMATKKIFIPVFESSMYNTPPKSEMPTIFYYA